VLIQLLQRAQPRSDIRQFSVAGEAIACLPFTNIISEPEAVKPQRFAVHHLSQGRVRICQPMAVLSADR
jgi:hypothetical protein